MFKKIVIFLLIAVVVGVSTIPLWTQKMAEKAFNNPNDPNSPVIIKEAMLTQIRIQRPSKGRELAEKAILYFPESTEMPYFVYNAAKCAEDERLPKIAVYWYTYFLKRFPKHQWAQQAKNHCEKLKELYNINIK